MNNFVKIDEARKQIQKIFKQSDELKLLKMQLDREFEADYVDFDERLFPDVKNAKKVGPIPKKCYEKLGSQRYKLFVKEKNDDFEVSSYHQDAINELLKKAYKKEKIDSTWLSDMNFLFFRNSKDAELLIGRYRYSFKVLYNLEYAPPNPVKIPEKMDEIFDKLYGEWKGLHPIQKASKLHNAIIALQPFEDSNKRMARLAMNYVLVSNGYPTINVKGMTNIDYRKAIRSALKENNDVPMQELIEEKIMLRQNEYMQKANKTWLTLEQ